MTPLDQPMMPIPVFVINMEQDRDSWELVANSVRTHGGDFPLHRVDALDARLIDPSDYRHVDPERFQQLNGRNLLPGEYGCYRSHLLALDAFLEEGSPYGIILEDDVLFNERTVTRISAIVEALPDFGAIKLVNHRRRYMIGLGTTGEADLIGRAMHGPQGSAAAYLVSREGARALLAELATMSLPWDVALERFWDSDADVFSVLDDVLDFSPHRARSTIAAGGYGKAKYSWHRRLGTAAFRFREIFSRAWHVMLPPDQLAAIRTENLPNRMTRLAQPAALDIPGWAAVLAGFVVLIFVSAVWIETDAYRYAGLALIGASLVHYFRTDFWNYGKPLVGWAGMLCIGWALYAGLRFVYVVLAYPHHGQGSAEGVYLLTLLYPTFGYGLLVFVRRPFVIATVFMLVSLAVVVLGMDYMPSRGIRALPYLQNNRIHAALACGMIALCAAPYALYALRRRVLSDRQRFLAVLLGAATFAAALYAVYATMAKGAWLAMVVAFPVLVVVVLATEKRHWTRWVAAFGVAAVLAGAFLARDMIDRVVSDPIAVTQQIVKGIASDGLLASLGEGISDPETPHSERERLMLWANALHIWNEYPIFGAGISWYHYWVDRPYQETTFNLLHNGYLEIAVRYGVTGLAFYAFLTIWSFLRIRQAVRAGLVDAAVLQCYTATMAFFAVSLLTNSNIRLAIGESYLWMATSVGFFCYYLLQRRGLTRPKTIF